MAFPGWFRRIVFKHCDRIQRQWRPAPQSLEAAGAEPVSADQGPAETVEKQELRDRVLAAVRDLPEHQRLVTTLFYINGYTVNDIADFLETPSGTIVRRLHDSRKQLKERMVAMVAEKLKSSKPGPEFWSKVAEAAALQRNDRFEEAVSAHQSALATGGTENIDAGPLADTYFQLSLAYHKTGKLLELATGLLEGVPRSPTGGQVVPALKRLHFAAAALTDAGETGRALDIAEQMQRLTQQLKGQVLYRFWISETLCTRCDALLSRNNRDGATRVLGEIYANLAAYEQDVASACPGLYSKEEAQDECQKEWFEWLGNAYHNLAARTVNHIKKDRQEALRLMRRAAALRDCPPTDLSLARWILSAGGDQAAALAHFRKAAQGYHRGGGSEWLRKDFATAEDFAPVRDDPGFLAALKE